MKYRFGFKIFCKGTLFLRNAQGKNDFLFFIFTFLKNKISISAFSV